MERRTFIRASLATVGTVAAASTGTTGTASELPRGTPMFELRSYRLKSAKLPLLEEYLSKALIPALKRQGAGPVGAVSDERGE